MRQHYSHWLPRLLKVSAITFNSYVFYSTPKEEVSARLRRHEKAHVEQYQRDSIIKFLVKYLFEYVKNRFQGMGHYRAYYNISYEKEARNEERRG